MATKPSTQPKPISPVAPPESSLQQFMRLQSTFAPKPIAPPTLPVPITTGIDENFFNSAPELAPQSSYEPPQRMEAAPYQYAPPVAEKTRPFGYKPGYGQVTEDPELTPERQIPLPQQADANDVMQRFRDTVLNPPQREHMTYPASTLGALDAAFKIAATPTDYEKNRVYVDGQAYQQAKQFIDPVTGEVKYINKYKQPGFMEQVLKAVPAGLPGAIDVMNQPHEDAVNDWKLRVEGLQKGITAESNLALAGQRTAQARNIPLQTDIRLMDAQTRQYLASLKDIPESTRLQMLQDGRMDIATYNAVQAYERQILSGNQAMDRTVVGGQLGIARQGMAGNQAAARQQVAGQQALTQIGAREAAQARLQAKQGVITSQHIAARGELQRQLQEQRAREALIQKAAPGWSGVNQSNSQQKIALQDRAMEVVNSTPGLAENITFNNQGFPVISGLDPETTNDVYESIYGESPSALPRSGQQEDINLPAPQAPQAPRPVAVQSPMPAAPYQPTPGEPAEAPVPQRPAPIAPQTPPPTQPGVQPIIQRSPSTGQYRISYDGGQTWRPYNPNGK